MKYKEKCDYDRRVNCTKTHPFCLNCTNQEKLKQVNDLKWKGDNEK